MVNQLTKEQRQALLEHPEGVEVWDEATQKVYILADAGLHRRAMEALRRQRQQEDRDAIAEGIAQMEAGQRVPLDEAFERIRARMKLPQRQQ